MSATTLSLIHPLQSTSAAAAAAAAAAAGRYHEESLKQMKFFDDNTRSWWTPITGGSNVPALNELLAPHGITLGERILQGSTTLGKHSLQVSHDDAVQLAAAHTEQRQQHERLCVVHLPCIGRCVMLQATVTNCAACCCDSSARLGCPRSPCLQYARVLLLVNLWPLGTYGSRCCRQQ
jgi:hypothetical protein